jgi:photosystem II stability/assembly factor-like uncharacterized protein
VAELLVATGDGVFAVDLDTEDVSARDAATEPVGEPVTVDLPLATAAARSGSTVVAVVARRPPLVVSHDAGQTWREAGGGLPPGRAVAVSPENPDLIAYAGRNRLFLSRDGGRFWQALVPELPPIQALRFE